MITKRFICRETHNNGISMMETWQEDSRQIDSLKPMFTTLFEQLSARAVRNIEGRALVSIPPWKVCHQRGKTLAV